MSSYHIDSVNGQNVQIGDHSAQYNTHVITDDQLAGLGASVDRHAPSLPDADAARRALHALRVACTARPVDAALVAATAGELAAATAAVPVIGAEIARLFGRAAR